MRYVVKDEHTLGCLIAEGRFMDVFAGNVFKGGHDPKNGFVSVSCAQLRPATEADFRAFRVAIPPGFSGELCPEGGAHDYVRDADAVTHHCCQRCGDVVQDAPSGFGKVRIQ